jgi:4-aminobutyrate aminotransferase
MQALEFTTADGAADSASAAAVQQAAVAERLLLLTCGPLNNVIRVVPALTVNESEVELALRALDAALASVLRVPVLQ